MRVHPLRPAIEAAYRAMQAALLAPTYAGQHALRRIGGVELEHPTLEALLELRRRYDALLRRDLANALDGAYPWQLLFDREPARTASALPRFLLDVPRVLSRRRAGNYRDLPSGVSRERFPAYYRRTFHWQSDGYFSARSARLYDLGVEFLFHGTADVMRRQILPPIRAYLGRTANLGRPAASTTALLDVACGTGSATRQIALAFPHIDVTGLDLSEAYLGHARRRIAAPAVRFTHGNAEALPFLDASFDIVTCVFLFHELPHAVRRTVARELARVTRPGGLIVVADSAQLIESSSLAVFFRNFQRQFHEPFYENYLSDPLEHLLEATPGVTVEHSSTAFVSKVVVARTASNRA